MIFKYIDIIADARGNTTNTITLTNILIYFVVLEQLHNDAMHNDVMHFPHRLSSYSLLSSVLAMDSININC